MIPEPYFLTELRALCWSGTCQHRVTCNQHVQAINPKFEPSVEAVDLDSPSKGTITIACNSYEWGEIHP